MSKASASKATAAKHTSSPAKKPTSTATTTKPLTSGPVPSHDHLHEFSDAYINQHSSDLDALNKIRSNLEKQLTQLERVLKQVEKDATSDPKSAKKGTKTTIDERRKEIFEMKRCKEKIDHMLATATDKSASTKSGDKSIKQVTMKEVLPKQMEKLQGLKKWPIIMYG